MPRRSPPLLLLVLIALLPAAALAEDDLLPDIITVEKRLHQHIFNWGFELGCVSLRLTNGTANIGAGPANIWGAPPLPDGTQPVYQRIWRADGSNWDRLAGAFVYHETHEHIHFEGWATYRLREWLPGNGVGAILVEGEKTSFCLMDSNSHDLTLPGAPLAPVFTTCEDVQGISVGWEDRYGLNLPGQEIRICGVPPGTYWLESEVDPDDHLLEEDESNNVARILVQMPPPPNCNDGEDDDGDGLVDFGADPGCSSLFSNRENPECDDGEDNDDDGFVDYPDDPECTSAARNAESESTCGLGAELALVVPALSWLHGARRRARSTRTAHRAPLV